MNNLLKLWTALIKDAGSKYAETHGILSDQHDGFRKHHSIHDALSSIIDAKFYHKDFYVMYADFKGAFNAADHRIMFKHMRQHGVPPSFVDTDCEHLYGVSSTDYITPYGSTPSININRGTLQGDTLSPFLFTLFLEPFLHWLTVGSRGYRPGPSATNVDPTKPTATYPGHGFADDLSLATGSTPNMSIQLRKTLPLQRLHSYDRQHLKMLHHRRPLALMQRHLPRQHHPTCITPPNTVHHITSNRARIPSIGPSDTYNVLGVELNTSLTFTRH
jgi:hypothetical protein